MTHTTPTTRSEDMSETRVIIDATNNVVVGEFHRKDTDQVLEIVRNEKFPHYNDVAVDRDGDIICWEE